MNWLQALILGIVQGITEFLPISSSGHLVLAQYFLNIHVSGLLIEISLHFGTLVAIVIYYFKDLEQLSINFISNSADARNYVFKIVIATFPAILFGLLLQNHIENMFSVSILRWTFLITGFIIFSTFFKNLNKSRSNISIFQAIFIGFMQVFAILPGISRSGVTIAIAMILGIRRKESAKFSFYLAIPVLLGAGILQLFKISDIFQINYFPLIIGMFSSAITGYIVIDWLLSVIYKGKFWIFSIYCFIIGILTIIII